jgi:hypothetical protein
VATSLGIDSEQSTVVVSWPEGGCNLVRYEGGRAVSIDLVPGDSPQFIPAQLEHRFIFLADQALAYEICWAANAGSIDPDDIVRRDEGGCLPVMFESTSGKPWLRSADAVGMMN